MNVDRKLLHVFLWITYVKVNVFYKALTWVSKNNSNQNLIP